MFNPVEKILGKGIRKDSGKSMVWWQGGEKIKKYAQKVDQGWDDPILVGKRTGHEVYTEPIEDDSYMKEMTGKSANRWVIYGTGPKVSMWPNDSEKPQPRKVYTPRKVLESGGYTDAKDVKEIKAYAKKKYGN